MRTFEGLFPPSVAWWRRRRRRKSGSNSAKRSSRIFRGSNSPAFPVRLSGSASQASILPTIACSWLPLATPLKPGIYKVTWHAVSVDTHRTQGSFNSPSAIGLAPHPLKKEKLMKHLGIFGLVALLAIAAGPAVARRFVTGDITVEKPWARATPKGAASCGGLSENS